MKNKDEIEDFPNDYIEERISKLEKRVSLLSVLMLSLLIIVIILATI
jgi:hypothetical protein